MHWNAICGDQINGMKLGGHDMNGRGPPIYSLSTIVQGALPARVVSNVVLHIELAFILPRCDVVRLEGQGMSAEYGKHPNSTLTSQPPKRCYEGLK